MTLPIGLENKEVYLQWREEKLADYPSDSPALTVNLETPGQPNPQQIEALKALCRKTNMAIYAGPEAIVEDKNIAINLGAALGLKQVDRSLTTEDDGVSELSVAIGGEKSAYIPYTDRSLGWHTDGCYNDADHLINGFLLHCVRAAPEGGENYLLDPEIAYILLRDENPDFIDGLMLVDALSIPANIENDKVIRAEQSGPALSIDPDTQALHLRYTGRKTYVTWRDDPRLQEALAFLKDAFNEQNQYIFKVKLKPGSGLIGNNVLHNRTKFVDGDAADDKRLIYRIYYHDRITNALNNN
ncbi:MAG: TauD/TfdA family dioxygenase [Rhodospirillaceae bacterium]|jgi:alpha-ketoglutarate-dependent taurine dioxygenase|nr:TauD/TfdA family dioxygenase [Rhodospirillaceae bacterium]MBT4589830.1 TauD/TfdA family dioxygenase [Rhodospirillaceae bacterium]MBT4939386.1 TauD/TfdA family dioxygenase [Rhodospirillaceae bacterium]MBT5938717.1 TauD/TfdA family dioxygenase [Rhodospirillaceae bacterium]MBT7266143.1 TauD/TfdA family dioxygenase [Rhodospirillaceae bacterium]